MMLKVSLLILLVLLLSQADVTRENIGCVVKIVYQPRTHDEYEYVSANLKKTEVRYILCDSTVSYKWHMGSGYTTCKCKTPGITLT